MCAQSLRHLSAAARHRVIFLGLGTATADSVRVTALSLSDGSQRSWPARFGEAGRVSASAPHAAFMQVAERQDWWTLYALDDPGGMTPLGTIPRTVSGITLSADGTRATVAAREYRADAWLYQVLRP